MPRHRLQWASTPLKVLHSQLHTRASDAFTAVINTLISLQVGTDVDPLSLKASARNAALNGVSDRFAALLCSASISDPEPLGAAGMPEEDRTFDVVVANILQVGVDSHACGVHSRVEAGGGIATCRTYRGKQMLDALLWLPSCVCWCFVDFLGLHVHVCLSRLSPRRDCALRPALSST